MQATLNGWIEPELSQIAGERRSRRRFALRLTLEYRILRGQYPLTGSGTTLDLSSTGIAFEAGPEVESGSQVELALQWPVPLGGSIPLKVIVRGTVVRSERGVAAMRVKQCQFHTQRRAAAAGMPLQ